MFFFLLFLGDITQKGFEKKRQRLLAGHVKTTQGTSGRFTVIYSSKPVVTYSCWLVLLHVRVWF